VWLAQIERVNECFGTAAFTLLAAFCNSCAFLATSTIAEKIARQPNGRGTSNALARAGNDSNRVGPHNFPSGSNIYPYWLELIVDE
jgi:hypothetical protein